MKKKKISQIVAYFALGIVAIAVLLCAIIKVDFKPEVNAPAYNVNSAISIEKVEGQERGGLLTTEEEHNEFVKKYENSFKLTVLYSLFSGKIGSETKIAHVKSKGSAVGYEVKFNFVEEQTFVNNDEEIEYSKIYFSVEKDKGLEEKTIWLYAGEDDYYKITTIANFDGLANYIETLAMFKVEEAE